MPTFISVDELTFRSTQQAMLRQLGEMGQKLADVVTQAMMEFARDLLAQMQALAPHKRGKLAESGHVRGPRNEGEDVVVEITWDAPYAWAQDQGMLITPKDFRATVTSNGSLRGKGGRFITRARTGAARLFIPLREGVTAANAKAAGYKHGIDFVFAKLVVIPPTGFITKVLYGRTTHFGGGSSSEGASLSAASGGALGNADRTVGQIAERLLGQIING